MARVGFRMCEMDWCYYLLEGALPLAACPGAGALVRSVLAGLLVLYLQIWSQMVTSAPQL